MIEDEKWENLDLYARVRVGSTYRLDGSNPLQIGYPELRQHDTKRVRVVNGPGLHQAAPAPWVYLELAEDHTGPDYINYKAGLFLGMFTRTVLQRRRR
jgi:hypothetical protein